MEPDMERRGTKALELWCRRVTEGYAGVKVDNMTTSWRDGLAFCALIHHFRPDLIDFSSLKKEDVFHNNELAFRTAESYLGIPALLDAEDMAQYAVPDRLSILTYLSQYYQYFASESSPSRLITKRSSSAKERDSMPESPSSASPPTKMSSGSLARRDPCTSCGQPVFLAQRLLVDRRLYHRTCFRCARCDTQLTLAGCYQTETDGQYCCETCPDEETYEEMSDKDLSMIGENNIEDKMASEEKKEEIVKEIPKWESSIIGDINIEDKMANDEKKVEIVKDIPKWESSPAFSGFMNSQFSQKDSDDDDVVPALPKSLPPIVSQEQSPSVGLNEPDVIGDNIDNVSDISDNKHTNIDRVDADQSETSALVSSSPDLVNIVVKDSNQLDTASAIKDDDKSVDNVVKDVETVNAIAKDKVETITIDNFDENKMENVESQNTSSNSSLVKSRMKIFETMADTNDTFVKKSNDQLVLERSDKSNVSVDVDDITSDYKTVVNETDIENESQVFKDDVPCNSTVNEAEVPLDESTKLTDTESFHDIIEEEVQNVSNISQRDDKDVDKESEHPKSDEIEVLAENALDVDANSEVIDKNDTSNQEEQIVTLELEDKKLKDEYPEHLNPFDDDDENEETTIEQDSDVKKKRDSKNPFDTSSEDEQDEPIEPKPNINTARKKSGEKPPRPPPPVFRQNSGTRKVITAPIISLNPFSSDEDSDNERPIEKPVPKPRQRIGEDPDYSSVSTLLSAEPRSFYGSSTSLTSTTSRKKKAPAPRPPVISDCSQSKPNSVQGSVEDLNNSSLLSNLSSPNSSLPQVSPRSRKRRPAPLPPSMDILPSANSTFIDPSSLNYNSDVYDSMKTYCPSPIQPDDKMSSITSIKKIISAAEFDNDPDLSISTEWEDGKLNKSEKNDSNMSDDILPSFNKSTSGQWKRRKGPAPAIPLLQRRSYGPMIPPAILRRELQLLEAQQRGLEKQGVRLEEIIRERCENTSSENVSNEPDPETDELVLQLFELVNEKNELFRRQSELMYIRRQQRLEEEYVDLEHQIRLLMARPEANKTDSDKAKEEQLIQRLVEVVEKRNEVVTSLEMDRLREKEEDVTIRERMASHRAKRDEGSLSSLETQTSQKDLSHKERKKWTLKKDKVKKKEEDKDNVKENVDQLNMKKKKKHKKWF